MINTAITFDYEIFFGKNYETSEEILFKPTEKIMKMLNKYDIKATFFVDVLSVLMSKENGDIKYVEQFEAQIKRLLLNGHDIQLHIHPHWLNSIYKNGEWTFDSASFRIHYFGFNNKDVEKWNVSKIINWGKQYLEKTLQPIKPSYECIAFRAGGYCIQPHGELFDILYKNGIIIDSSIAMKQYADGVNKYDYRKLPKRMGWWIDPKFDISMSALKTEGAIFEVPVWYKKNNLCRRIFVPNFEKNINSGIIRGSFIGQSEKKDFSQKNFRLRIKNALLYSFKSRILSVDTIPSTAIISMLREASKIKNENNKYLSIIGHPKLLNDDWINNFENLLVQIKKAEWCSCVTMFEIYQQLKNKKIYED